MRTEGEEPGTIIAPPGCSVTFWPDKSMEHEEPACDTELREALRAWLWFCMGAFVLAYAFSIMVKTAELIK